MSIPRNGQSDNRCMSRRLRNQSEGNSFEPSRFRFGSSGQAEDKATDPITAPPHSQGAAREISVLTDRCRTEAMPAAAAMPSFSRRFVFGSRRLRFRKRTRRLLCIRPRRTGLAHDSRPPRRCFGRSEQERPIAEYLSPGRKRRAVCIVGVIRGAPADNMDSPVHDNHSHVVAGRAQGRGSLRLVEMS